jgi:formiminotetrahydrofolate cyclodeaminase
LASSDPLGQQLGELLDDLAAETPAPGAGAVAAVAVALAAALVEMAARFSQGAEDALAAASALRARVGPLAQADGEAYAEFLAARRAGADDSEARARAVAIPLEIAECGSEVAALAASLGESGNPNLRGEAVAAARTASAGAAIAAALVELNLGGEPGERLERARRLAAAAEERAASLG